MNQPVQLASIINYKKQSFRINIRREDQFQIYKQRRIHFMEGSQQQSGSVNGLAAILQRLQEAFKTNNIIILKSTLDEFRKSMKSNDWYWTLKNCKLIKLFISIYQKIPEWKISQEQFTFQLASVKMMSLQVIALYLSDLETNQQQIINLGVLEIFAQEQHSNQSRTCMIILFLYTNLILKGNKINSLLWNTRKWAISLISNKEINLQILIDELIGYFAVYLSQCSQTLETEERKIILETAFEIIVNYNLFIYERKKSKEGEILFDAFKIVLHFLTTIRYQKQELIINKYDLSVLLAIMQSSVDRRIKAKSLTLINHLIYLSDQWAIVLNKKTILVTVLWQHFKSEPLKKTILLILNNLATIDCMRNDLYKGFQKMGLAYVMETDMELKKLTLKFFIIWFSGKECSKLTSVETDILNIFSQFANTDMLQMQIQLWVTLTKNRYNGPIPNRILNADNYQLVDQLHKLLNEGHTVT